MHPAGAAGAACVVARVGATYSGGATTARRLASVLGAIASQGVLSQILDCKLASQSILSQILDCKRGSQSVLLQSRVCLADPVLARRQIAHSQSVLSVLASTRVCASSNVSAPSLDDEGDYYYEEGGEEEEKEVDEVVDPGAPGTEGRVLSQTLKEKDDDPSWL